MGHRGLPKISLPKVSLEMVSNSKSRDEISSRGEGL